MPKSDSKNDNQHETSYFNLIEALTPKEREIWNNHILDMYAMTDLIAWDNPVADKLANAIMRLPIFHKDGKTVSWTGDELF